MNKKLRASVLRCLFAVVHFFGLAPAITHAQESSGLRDRYGDPIPEGAFAVLGTNRLRHADEIHSIAVTLDNKIAVSSAFRVWEVASGKELPQFQERYHGSFFVAFSNDGKTLFVADRETLHQWDVASGKQFKKLGLTQLNQSDYPKYPLHFSPDRKWLAIDGTAPFGRLPGKVIIVELATGKKVLSLQGDFSSVAFSADGGRLILGHTGKKNRRDSDPPVRERQAFKIYELPSGRLVKQFQGPAEWSHQAFLAGKDWITRIPHDDYFELVDLKTSKALAQVLWSGIWTFSGNGDKVAVADSKAIRVHEVKTGRILQELTFMQPLRSMTFSPDGSLFFVGTKSGAVVAWDLATGKELHSYPGHRGRITSLVFSPDGKTLASAGEQDGSIYVWDWRKSRDLHRFTSDDPFIGSLAYSPDGKILAAGEGSGRAHSYFEAKIRLWDMDKGKLRHEWIAHLDGVRSLAFSPDGRHLASVGGDARVRLWDWASARRFKQIRLDEQVYKVGFCPQKNLVCQTVQETLSWQMESFRPLQGDELKKARTWAAQWKGPELKSPDGRSTMRTLHELWEEAANELLRKFDPGEYFCVVAYTPDSRVLAAGTREGAIVLYDVPAMRNDFYWLQIGKNPGSLAGAKHHWQENPTHLASFYQQRFKKAFDQLGRFQPMIARLDSAMFAEREKAMKSLAKAGADARLALTAAQTDSTSLEARRRIGELLDKLPRSDDTTVKAMIAFVQILGELNTLEARTMLEEIANGPVPPFRSAAKAALDRHGKSAPLK